MSSKSEILGLRKALYKCDICGRRLMSAKSLKNHQDLAHKERGKRKYASNKGAVKKKKNTSRAKIVFGKVKFSANARQKNIFSRTETDTKAAVKNGSAAILSNPVDVSNVEYECPICMKIFPAYFSASMHIQKNHCTQVKYVAKCKTNTRKFKNPLEPLLKEICMKCNQRIPATESHHCSDMEENEEMKSNMYYKCSGCNQQFTSLILFDLHIAKLHSNGVETMFIPNIDEFLAWKRVVEKKTKVKYALLERYKSKKIYHCTFSPHDGNFCDGNTIYCCPATISIQEFSEGVQVRFYKEHYGHACDAYVIAEKYKKYSLTSLLQNTDVYATIDKPNVNKKDLYFQFQRLMECIVVNAGKLNVEALKLLYGRALAMTFVLNNYIEDTDLSSLFMDKVVGDNIIWELGNLEKNQGKEKNSLLYTNKLLDPSILRQFESPPKQVDHSMPSSQNVMLMPVVNDPNKISRCFNTPHILADQNEPSPQNVILMSMLNAPNKINECFNLTKPVMSKTQSKLNSKNELNMEGILNSSTQETPPNVALAVNTKEIKYVRAPVPQNPPNMPVVVCKELGKEVMYVPAFPLNMPPVVAGKEIRYVPAAAPLNISRTAAGVADREIRHVSLLQNIRSGVVDGKEIRKVKEPLPQNTLMIASCKEIGHVSEPESLNVKETKLGPASFSDTYKDFVSKYFYKCPSSTSNKRT